MVTIEVNAAEHSHVAGQTSVRLTTRLDGKEIPKGTLRLRFCKFFRVRAQRQKERLDPITLGELPPTPAWLKDHYPDYLAPEDLSKEFRWLQEFQETQIYKEGAKSRELVEEFKRFTKRMPEGFLVPRVVAEEFCNCPVPTGEAVFFFSRVFPQSVDPWDFIRVSLLDQSGAELASTNYVPA